MDPLPKVFALLSKHTDTSSNGKPLQNAQCQLTDCLIHVLVHFPIHCTVFICTIYAGKEKNPRNEVQCPSYILPTGSLQSHSDAWLCPVLTETRQNMRRVLGKIRVDFVLRISELGMSNCNCITFLFLFILSPSHIWSHLPC